MLTDGLTDGNDYHDEGPLVNIGSQNNNPRMDADVAQVSASLYTSRPKFI